MAKYEKVKEPVFVTSCELISSRHKGEVYEIKMMGIQSQKSYKTYADPRNNNWQQWSWIIDLSERKGVVLMGCKLKDPNTNLINADSNIVPEYVVTKEELADTLEEFWKSRDNFNKLFNSEN
tara:strand:+ start:926 stop:1291 length:366 start_codon:yes stop_codon:yes gene_type:complete